VPSRQHHYFCQQLNDWLYASEWHFTTLLAICIDSINNLPNDTDNFINCLLLSYSTKPSYTQLNNYIKNSTIIENWFKRSAVKPSISSFNLNSFGSVFNESAVNADSNFLKINSFTELADWLNLSITQLDWLADIKRVDEYEAQKYRHYHYSLLKKRRGGVRVIESPKRRLKQVQRKIHSHILAKTSPHNAAHGFRQNRSCLSHAENHTGKRYIFSFDLANCFHSIDWYHVYKSFRNIGFSQEVAKTLSSLCTHRFNGSKSILKELDKTQQKLINKRHLAQGAPTSPALSNLVMHELDKRLDSLAKSLKLQYSRYADDLAFSGNSHRDWRFLEPLIGSICIEQGFELNYRKSKILHAHQRQKITGVVVNQGANIDRRYYDRLKAILTNCIRHGVESQNIERHKDFSASLLGRIMFVTSLNKNRGKKLMALYRQIIFI